MAKIKKLLALILSICVICTVSVMSVSAANTDDDNDTSASSTITVHYYCEEGTPTIYYWNSLPKNISTEYPGVKMTSEGNNYYKYTFNDVTKINMMFVTNGKQSAELTRNTGEWWYKNKRWSSKNPEDMQEFDRVDMREDTIYFVITTRFYDGDTGNDVHCWDDSQANNPDSDPAWRGDFKGLIDKLDYIKALGFSASEASKINESTGLSKNVMLEDNQELIRNEANALYSSGAVATDEEAVQQAIVNYSSDSSGNYDNRYGSLDNAVSTILANGSLEEGIVRGRTANNIAREQAQINTRSDGLRNGRDNFELSPGLKTATYVGLGYMKGRSVETIARAGYESGRKKARKQEIKRQKKSPDKTKKIK